MKKTKLPKKLVLTKKTVANLDFSQQKAIKGGYRTIIWQTIHALECLETFTCSVNPEECP